MYEVTKGLGRTHRLAKSLAVNIVGEIRVNPLYDYRDKRPNYCIV